VVQTDALREPGINEGILYLAWEEDGLDLSLVKSEWFTIQADRLLWDAIVRWKQEGRPKDVSLFCLENKLGLGYIWAKGKRYDPSPYSWKDYAKKLEEDSLMFGVKSVVDELSFMSPKESIEIMRKYLAKVDEMESSELRAISARGYTNDYLEDLESRKLLKEPELMSGYKTLDRWTWGLNRGELITIAAGTSKGKSTLLLNIIVNLLKKDKKVLYFSTEMSVKEQYDRLAANMNLVPYRKLRQAKLSEAEWASISNNLAWLHEKNNLYICDSVALDSTKIGVLVDRVKPDVAVLDYLGLFKFAKSERRDIGISEFMSDVKKIARHNNVCVLIASQLNRNVEGRTDKIPTLADLKDSSSIEQESDVVMFLYDDLSDVSRDENVRNLKLSLDKNRHGECGTLSLVFTTNILKMLEKDIVRSPGSKGKGQQVNRGVEGID